MDVFLSSYHFSDGHDSDFSIDSSQSRPQSHEFRKPFGQLVFQIPEALLMERPYCHGTHPYRFDSCIWVQWDLCTLLCFSCISDTGTSFSSFTDDRKSPDFFPQEVLN